jgi:hypothetical protein
MPFLKSGGGELITVAGRKVIGIEAFASTTGRRGRTKADWSRSLKALGRYVLGRVT